MLSIEFEAVGFYVKLAYSIIIQSMYVVIATLDFVETVKPAADIVRPFCIISLILIPQHSAGRQSVSWALRDPEPAYS